MWGGDDIWTSVYLLSSNEYNMIVCGNIDWINLASLSAPGFTHSYGTLVGFSQGVQKILQSIAHSF